MPLELYLVPPEDGGKETFLIPDEVHLYVLPELRGMYATAMRNLGKRKLAEPWAPLTTTACRRWASSRSGGHREAVEARRSSALSGRSITVLFDPISY